MFKHLFKCNDKIQITHTQLLLKHPIEKKCVSAMSLEVFMEIQVKTKGYPI